MEQAFILPLPRYCSSNQIEPTDLEQIRQNEQIAIWQSILNGLSEKKITWEQIGTYLSLGSEDSLDHPLAAIVSSRKGQTLLHLAVLHGQDEWVWFLSMDPKLRERRNHFGLTPFELARFLYRTSYMAKPHSFPSHLFATEDLHPVKNFSYIPHPIFESPSILEEVLHCSKRAKEEDLIAPEKIWMGVYFDQEIQSGLHPRLSVRYIDEELGFGVFANQKIPSCAFVGEYTGIVKERTRQAVQDKIYCVRYNCWSTGCRKFTLDAETHGNYTRFINHSSKPNLALQSVYWRGLPRMVFVSLKEISEGCQLTFDYGRSFWKEMKKQPRPVL